MSCLLAPTDLGMHMLSHQCFRQYAHGRYLVLHFTLQAAASNHQAPCPLECIGKASPYKLHVAFGNREHMHEQQLRLRYCALSTQHVEWLHTWCQAVEMRVRARCFHAECQLFSVLAFLLCTGSLLRRGSRARSRVTGYGNEGPCCPVCPARTGNHMAR